jgi:hypothetical protein
MYSLRMCLDPASSGVIATVAIARRVVLDMGATILFVYYREQDAVHPQPKIFISKATGLLLFAV